MRISSLRSARRALLVVALALVTGAFLASTEKSPEVVHAAPSSGTEIEAKAPPFSEDVFPCSMCHEEAGDPERRELGFHEEIQEIFTHGAENRWCLDCHDNEDRDVLHLTNGEPVPYEESYRLCGQCHGDKYRDWRAGVHGRRVGSWNGDKTYLLCVNCHNPHAPAFKSIDEIEVDGVATVAPSLEPMKPEPVPVRPEEMRR